MQIFDSHFHIETGLERYNLETTHKNVIFNSYASYLRHVANVAPTDTITLIFDFAGHLSEIKSLLDSRSIDAVKIHSRIQRLGAGDYGELIRQLAMVPPSMPIIVDAFYYGDDYDHQPDLGQIINIARACPLNPVVIAHSGGIEVLRYFYHLKTLTNVYFELSLSLAYLRNTSVFADFVNLVRFGNKKQIVFGSDYPTVTPRDQYEAFMEIAGTLNLEDEVIRQLLFGNFYDLFPYKYNKI